MEEKSRRDHNEQAWLAYHIEALRRSKKLPRMEKLLTKKRGAKGPPMPWQQQHLVLAAWSARIERAINIKNSLGKN